MSASMKTNTVLLAAHDDGWGAFSILARLGHALLKIDASREDRKKIQVAIVSQKIASDSALRDFGLTDGRVSPFFPRYAVNIPKDTSKGSVDAVALQRSTLPSLATELRDWAAASPVPLRGWASLPAGDHRAPAELPDFDLAISMGSPWVHGLARRLRKPSVEVGDMCFSVVLRGCLAEADCLNHFGLAVLDELAEYELSATEAWLLPFAAPREYEDHFAQAGVPVNWLPGVPGTQDRSELVHGTSYRRELERVGFRASDVPAAQAGRPLVGVHAGGTRVWDGAIAALEARSVNTDPAFLTVRDKTLRSGKTAPYAWLLEQSRKPLFVLPSMPSRIPLYRQQHLGVTRGGITVLDHIAARCPLAIAEEPYHWLSHRQRENVVQAGLAIPMSLADFRNRAEETIDRFLKPRSEGGEREHLEEIRARMAGIEVGAEAHLAKYLVSRYNL